MLTPIHNHFNARRLCQVDLSAEVVAKLEKPPKLQDPRKPEDHIVKVATAQGEMILFRIVVNGVPLVATSTPDIALASAAGA